MGKGRGKHRERYLQRIDAIMGALLNPTVLLATLLVVGYASLFHLWTGRSLRELLLFLVVAAIGFALGQWAGRSLQLDILRIGQLYILETIVASFLALFLVKTLNLL